MQKVGVIRMVARYPVKSMRGDAYASLPLTLQGFEEDRRFAFVQAESRSDFPWLTARQMPELVRWQTSVEKPGTPERRRDGHHANRRTVAGGEQRASAGHRETFRKAGLSAEKTNVARSMSRTSPSSASRLSNALPRNRKPRLTHGAFGQTCW